MKRTKPRVKLLSRYSTGLVALSLIGVIIPILLLAGFGLYAIFDLGFAVEFAIALFISTLLVMVPRFIWQRREDEQPAEVESESLVSASAEWSDAEMEIWSRTNEHIQLLLEDNDGWSALKQHSFSIVEAVAEAYGKKELDFTVPEGLQLLEEISRRYRRVLDEHVPAVEKVKVSQLKRLYEVGDNYAPKAVKMGKRGLLAWRLFRGWANPAAALASEASGAILGSLTDQVTDNFQRNAKRALLQEVASVAIDLYSGRYIIDSQNLTASKVSVEDQQQMAPALEPLRVVVVGQVSAGKSSIVNALTNEMQAEVDLLPSTDRHSVYQCCFDGREELRLVDMPGLDGSVDSQERALKQITQADLVLWVLKANQSARQLDSTLAKKIEAFYSTPDKLSVKKPKFIGVVNQVDRLKPVPDWSPPYDLNDTDNEKGVTIQAALEYNRSLLPLDRVLPLALPENKASFGLIELETEIQVLCDDAKNVQLNRQRNGAAGASSVVKQGKRLFKASGKIIGNMVQ